MATTMLMGTSVFAIFQYFYGETLEYEIKLNDEYYEQIAEISTKNRKNMVVHNETNEYVFINIINDMLILANSN
ncbi:MAG: hypothetical protein ACK5LT_05165 [Lachnospirales bacterium]